jgi:hypothetical protein
MDSSISSRLERVSGGLLCGPKAPSWRRMSMSCRAAMPPAAISALTWR